jgi:magnesium transporter
MNWRSKMPWKNTAGRKLETFGDALFIVTYSPMREDGKLKFIETHIFAGNGYIITAATATRRPTHVRQRCEARPLLLEHGEDFVLYACSTS